jgi:hypothetical protein
MYLSINHLFYKCRYTMRVWRMVKEWLGLGALEINRWAAERNTKSWWTNMSKPNTAHRKGMTSPHYACPLGCLEGEKC